MNWTRHFLSSMKLDIKQSSDLVQVILRIEHTCIKNWGGERKEKRKQIKSPD